MRKHKPPLTGHEVVRRFPGLTKIENPMIRREVVKLTREAPAYFWTVPAASPDSDYHHPSCRREHGLWRHTLMLVPIIARLAESLLEQDNGFGRVERDCAFAAAYLHDQRKRGPAGDPSDSTRMDHAVLMADVIETESNLPGQVAAAVESHMGPASWGYDGSEPSSRVQRLVHTADMLASTPDVEPLVPSPVPVELAEQAGGGSQ